MFPHDDKDLHLYTHTDTHTHTETFLRFCSITARWRLVLWKCGTFYHCPLPVWWQTGIVTGMTEECHPGSQREMLWWPSNNVRDWLEATWCVERVPNTEAFIILQDNWLQTKKLHFFCYMPLVLKRQSCSKFLYLLPRFLYSVRLHFCMRISPEVDLYVWRKQIQHLMNLCNLYEYPPNPPNIDVLLVPQHSRIGPFSMFISKAEKRHLQTFCNIFIRSCGPKVLRHVRVTFTF